MQYRVRLLILGLLLFGLAAHADSGGDGGQAGNGPAAASAALFDETMSKRGCEILTAGVVSATFDVPADGLKQMKIMGCRYSWEDEAQTLEAAISMLRVYDNAAAAASWFATATKNRTAEEMQQEMDKVAARLDESRQLETDQQKDMAKKMLANAGGKAAAFEDVEGVGDEARVSGEGTVYVRVGNLTFMVSAYKGPAAPPVDYTGADLQQMAKIAKESADKWAVESAPQRKQDGARLAEAIVAGL